jgi:hypothetical protein
MFFFLFVLLVAPFAIGMLLVTAAYALWPVLLVILVLVLVGRLAQSLSEKS